ncbi:hypothetical protein HK104_007309, partial [Borealophlyctis nickersoniae]
MLALKRFFKKRIKGMKEKTKDPHGDEKNDAPSRPVSTVSEVQIVDPYPVPTVVVTSSEKGGPPPPAATTAGVQRFNRRAKAAALRLGTCEMVGGTGGPALLEGKGGKGSDVPVWVGQMDWERAQRWTDTRQIDVTTTTTSSGRNRSNQLPPSPITPTPPILPTPPHQTRRPSLPPGRTSCSSTTPSMTVSVSRPSLSSARSKPKRQSVTFDLDSISTERESSSPTTPTTP